MPLPLENILKLLSEEFEITTKLFLTDDWQKYKFGQGGPYKRVLTKLQRMSNDHDKIIFDRFGIHDDNASFTKLIVLCLRNTDTYKELYIHISTFRRQIKRMRNQL